MRRPPQILHAALVRHELQRLVNLPQVDDHHLVPRGDRYLLDRDISGQCSQASSSPTYGKTQVTPEILPRMQYTVYGLGTGWRGGSSRYLVVALAPVPSELVARDIGGLGDGHDRPRDGCVVDMQAETAADGHLLPRD